jgi:Lon-like protease
MSWLRRLSPRGRALAVGLILTSTLVTLGATVRIPYVAVGPGSTINVLGTYRDQPVFTFSGTDIPPATGEPIPAGSHLNMTTVSVTPNLSLFGALGLWASGNYALAPREEYFPPDKTVEEIEQQNAKLFRDSQSVSEVAALRYLNANDQALQGKYPDVTYVGSIAEGSPSLDVLDPQDRILAVDQQPVTSADSLRALLRNTSPGQVVTVTVRRKQADNTFADVDQKVTLAANAQVGAQGFLGISPVQRPSAPFTISNGLASSQIGGPSAGLMFTLGIIDRLTPGDLAGGRYVAGTGTIDENGNVGPIGGILLKEITVSRARAEFLLVPAGNCPEAVTRVPDGLTLVKVTTVTDAMAALEAIRGGRPTTGC